MPDKPPRTPPPSRPESTSRKKKFQLNLRVSDLARDLLGRIGDKHGMNLTHALEYAIRQTARNEGVWDIGERATRRDR